MTGPRHADRPSHTPNYVEGAPLNPDALEVAPGAEHQKLEGSVPELATEEDLRAALEKAFDYRGDVTITLKNGTNVEGYIFDRRNGATLRDSFVRVIPVDTSVVADNVGRSVVAHHKVSSQKLSIAYAEIAALAFTGRDTAAGKSWEAWVRNYWQKKAAGEKSIALQPEKLD